MHCHMYLMRCEVRGVRFTNDGPSDTVRIEFQANDGRETVSLTIRTKDEAEKIVTFLHMCITDNLGSDKLEFPAIT